MAFIKQEPLSEEQWDQFIKNFENEPDAYFPSYENITLDQDESSANNTANPSFGEVTGQAAENVKSGPVNPNVDWTIMNPANQAFEISGDNVPDINLDLGQISLRLDEIKALLEENSRDESDLEGVNTTRQPPMGGQDAHHLGQHATRQKLRSWLNAAPALEYTVDVIKFGSGKAGREIKSCLV